MSSFGPSVVGVVVGVVVVGGGGCAPVAGGDGPGGFCGAVGAVDGVVVGDCTGGVGGGGVGVGVGGGVGGVGGVGVGGGGVGGGGSGGGSDCTVGVGGGGGGGGGDSKSCVPAPSTVPPAALIRTISLRLFSIIASRKRASTNSS